MHTWDQKAQDYFRQNMVKWEEKTAYIYHCEILSWCNSYMFLLPQQFYR